MSSEDASRAPNFYTALSDNQLLGLLRVSEDRLSRRAVDEFLRRPQTVPALASMALNKDDWEAQGPISWAPIHATFILGAMGNAAPVLVEAMSLAARRQSNVVTAVIDEIIGAQGPSIWDTVNKLITTAGESDEAKGFAASSLAALAIRFPAERERVRARLTSIIGDAFARPHLRESAAAALLRLRDPRDRALLEHWATTSAVLDPAAVASSYEMVEETLSGPSWLVFYDDQSIRSRA